MSLLRHAVHRGGIAPRQAGAGAGPSARGVAPHRPRGGRRAGARPPPRRGAPGHQAGEHPSLRRPRRGGRLRDRARARPGRRRVAHPDRPDDGDAAVHEPRADHRREGDRRPGRPLRARVRALRDADGCATRVRRRVGAVAARPPPRRGAAPGAHHESPGAPGDRARPAQGARGGAGRTVRHRGGIRRGDRRAERQLLGPGAAPVRPGGAAGGRRRGRGRRRARPDPPRAAGARRCGRRAWWRR